MDNQLIEKVVSFRDDVLSKISNRDIITFKLGDLSFDDNINVHGNVVTDAAISRILTSLKVQKKFLDYSQTMTKEQWDQVRNTLQDVNKNIEFWGKKVTDNKGNSRITKLFQKNEMAAQNNDSVGFRDYFDMLVTSLEGTNIEYELKEPYFDEKDEKVIMRFIDKNSEVSVFEDRIDNWKKGVDLTFDLLQYQSSPFFERLVCSNGMVSREHGFSSNIRNQSFKAKDIQKEINRLLIKGDSKLDQLLINAVNHLRTTDISVREFYEYRDHFASRNSEGNYDHIINKFFAEAPLFRAYGVNPTEQTDRWQSSATSGRNGYDFFNDLTWLASHPTEAKIDTDDALTLQIKSGNLLFKKKLDLEDMAPKVNLTIEKIMQHNN